MRKGHRSGEFKKCSVCGVLKYFHQSQIKRGYGRYCSRACMVKQEGVEKKKCLTCGKELKNTLGCKRGKYCSYNCFGMSIRNRVDCVCELCGKKFENSPSKLVRKGRGKFCSKRCFDESQRKGHKDYTCKACGQSISHRGRRAYQYCSYKCSHYAQQHRKGPNKLELAGGNILKELGLEFEEQVLLFNKFTVDVFVKNSRLVIQWDGDYWHGNPKVFKMLNEIQTSKKKRDKACNAYLRKCGLKVLRFWERDVKGRPEWVKSKIIGL